MAIPFHIMKKVSAMTTTKQEIGARHRHVRETIFKQSVVEYSALMGVSPPTVYSWEAGRTNVPQSILVVLAREYKISSHWLLTGKDSPIDQTSESASGKQPESKTVLERLEEHVSSFRSLLLELKSQAPEVLAPARRSSGSARIPMLSLGVSAGAPTASDDTIESEIDLAEMLLEHPESTYFIRVVGDSMTDAGISDGDTLIVDCAIQPRSGQIVIAKVYGELTVKRYLKADGRPILRAENRRYKDISITADMDFAIVGVVRSCIKKL